MIRTPATARARGRALGLIALLSFTTPVVAQRPPGAGGSPSDAASTSTAAPRRPDYAPAAYAIKGATIVTTPGQEIKEGTVIVRGGVIEAVGPAAEVAVPYDAEVIEGKGLVVYAGFVDAFTNEGIKADETRSETGKGRPIPLKEFAQASTPPDNRNGLTPEFRAADAIEVSATTGEARRKLGFTALVAAPDGSIATGQSALVALSGLNRREAVMATPVALHVALSSPRGRAMGLTDDLIDRLLGSCDENCAGHSHAVGSAPEATQWLEEAMADSGPPDSGNFPGSQMGTIAHLRQAMLDADTHHARRAFHDAKGGPTPPFDPALEALYVAKTGGVPTWWEAESEEEIHRALDLAKEFGTSCVIVGGREADEVVDRLKADGASVVLKINFPKKPEVPSEADYRKKPLKEREKPLRQLQHEKQDWDERVACAKVLAEKDVPFALSTDNLTQLDTFNAQVKHLIDGGLAVDAALAALTTDAAALIGQGDRLGAIAPGKLGHLVAWTGAYGSKDAKPRWALIDGLKFDLEAKPATEPGGRGPRGSRPGGGRPDGPKPDGPPRPDGEPSKTDDQPTTDEAKPEEDVEPDDDREDESKPKSEARKADAKDEEGKKEEPSPDDDGPFVDVATEFDEDRVPGTKTGGSVLIKDLTILTVTNGTIPKGSILIKDGKIAAIGETVEAPEGVLVVDGAGMVAAPGIIDTHSHMAISGGVNEGTLSIVPEVRVKDVVNGDDVTIYHAAAGGVTAARLLHGSANTIGGQDAVIKLHYGKPARDLVVRDGPQGVKFALGENVTQKRGTARDRFPFTRMGVEAVLIRAFEEGRDYQTRRRAYAEALAMGQAVTPFRRDLRLEAIADMLDGRIKIHSHCYRSDEILMLLRTAEHYGMRVQSLQHVLEGYKIAPEIAAHGASSSTFSDWWAYKVEAYDAIPYNTALLTQAGADVCIKSDSEEEVRHLNLEAAKMVRYGGLTEDQALATITINCARQLGLDHRIGSLEVGKDADLALYDAHPLDGFAQCQLTLVDGEIVFQRAKGDNGAVVLKPRPGDHARMPQASADQREHVLDIDLNPAGSYALTHATLHSVSGPTIEGGTLVVEGGKIAAVGGADTPVPPGATTVDLGGLDVWPGMIDAGSIVGLTEIESISATLDSDELAPNQPELRASVAINPESALIPVSRAGGVLSAFVRPTGGTISGQGALVDLAGWVYPELVQKDEVALFVNLPPTPPANFDEMIAQVPPQFAARFKERYEGREKRLAAIKDQFRQARAYAAVVKAAKEQDKPLPPPDPRMTALAPYAAGEKPVVFNADGRNEILQALEFTKELGLRAIISGGGEAWKVADAIKKAGVPVIVQATQRVPSATDPYDACYANPAKLSEAGVTFAIAASGTAAEQRNLPFEAATAAGYGLSEEEALKAVTLYPAQILGVADSHGTLEPGKRANLVITAGHLLQPTSEVKHLFIGGRPIEPTSRHTEFYEKYKGRLAEVQQGLSPLGLEPKDGRVAGSPVNASATTASPTGPASTPAAEADGRRR